MDQKRLSESLANSQSLALMQLGRVTHGKEMRAPRVVQRPEPGGSRQLLNFGNLLGLGRPTGAFASCPVTNGPEPRPDSAAITPLTSDRRERMPGSCAITVSPSHGTWE